MEQTRQDTFKDKLIPWYLVIFFIVIFIVNGFFVYFATNSFTGLETKDAYNKGLAYNETLIKKNEQEKLGWKDHFYFTAEPSGNHNIRFSLTKNKADINIEKIEAILFRPSHHGQDITLTFEKEKNGEFISYFTIPLKGLWEARITAYKGETQYKQNYRFSVQ